MRVLLAPSAVGRSHLTRLLLVADALRERGAEVTFAYGGAHAELLAARGIPVLGLADAKLRDLGANVWAAYTEELLEAAVGDLVAGVRETGAEALVFDLHPAGAIAAAVAGVPSASVGNADLTAGLAAAPGPSDRLAGALLRSHVRSLARPMRAVAKRHGLRGRETLYDFLLGDATLLADLPEWAPSRSLAPGARYVGPLVWEEALDGAPLPAGDPARTIYVTLGNTGRRELLDSALDAFSGRYELLVSTGAYAAPPAARDGMHARRFLPGTEAARRSALVVHAGGAGTTYQALGAGRPMIVVPGGPGQELTARAATRHHVGVGFRPDGLDPARLLAAAEAILGNPGFRVAAARFARLVEAADGPGEAAEAVLGLGGA